MQIVSIEEAEMRLSDLMDRAIAGEKIFIGPIGKPLVMLVPFMLPTEVANAYVASAYAEMAADKDREAEAKEWE
jgi:antitoxin (DNA-binding transcriptional repressor) of toxin-antitoxin stability system